MATFNDIQELARTGKLFLDCVEMELKQNTDESPIVLCGVGFIKQNAEGWLEFKLYCRDAQNLKGPTPNDTRAGELIKGPRYFTLSALDHSSHRWTGFRILPDLHYCDRDGAPFLIVSGTIFEMESEHDFGVELLNHHLTLTLYSNIEIPFNSGTVYSEAVRNEPPQIRRTVTDRAEFEALDCSFTIREKNDQLHISVESPLPLSGDFESRIMQGLLFVLGRPLAWNESLRISGRTERLRLRSRVISEGRFHMKEPILIYQDRFYHRAWILLDLYLRLISSAPEPNVHPCSSHLFDVSHSSAATPEAFVLVLAVAIEGLVSTLYDRLGEKPESFKESVDALLKYALKWPALKESGIAPTRISDVIGGLKRVTPQDRMYLLAESGEVVKEHVDAWKRVRRNKAHALDDHNSSDRQQIFRDIDTLTVLMYHLVFKAIGYEGAYMDYSTIGYPVRLYPPGLPQPENSTDLLPRSSRFRKSAAFSEPPSSG